jgi:predicted permease
MRSFGQDVRLGLRGLLKSPGFTFVAVLTLALGIGANTAIFSVLNAVLLRALPAEDPQRLVMLSNPEYHGISIGDSSGKRGMFAFSEFRDLLEKNQVFSGMLAVDSHVRRTDVTVAGARSSEPEHADVAMVSGDYFKVLGIRPFLGRTFTAEVDRVQHANPVGVISYGYWKSRFAGADSIIGQKIRLRRTTFDIIGVAREGFSGETIGLSTDIWVPLTMQDEVFPGWTNFLDKPANPLQKILWLQVIGRLKPGVTLAQAQASINVTQRQIREADVANMSADRRREYLDSTIQLTDGSRGASTLSEAIQPLQILMAVVGMVLLIACANVANLVLARGTARQREIAVRIALGASRVRILQQLLVESVLLAVAGGVFGFILAHWAAILLVSLVSTASDPTFLDLRPDARIFALTLGVSVLTGILCGLVPGLRAARQEINATLSGGAKGSLGRGAHDGRLPAGRILVAGQIAVSLAVLMVAGLFLRSFQSLTSQNAGFDHDHMLQFDLGFLEASGYKGPAIHRVHEELLARLATIPQAKGATLAFMGLFAGDDTGSNISLDGSTPKAGSETSVREDLVPAGHFAAIGQPVVLGREFTADDENSTQAVGVINQTFARKYFGNGNPLGKRVWYDHDHPQSFAIVGVVGDAKHNSLREPAFPQFYRRFFNAKGDEPSFCSFEVRYSGNPAAVTSAIRAAVREVAPRVPPVEIRTMNDLMGETLVTERAISRLTGIFGLLALALAAVGLYGVMSYNVTGRTNEIGIRMSLGAQPGDILKLVMREILILIGTGVGLGLPSIWAIKRIVGAQLFGITALDPLAISSAAFVLAAVAMLAGYLPARWASRVEPMRALHYDG